MARRDVIEARLVKKDLDAVSASACQHRDRLYIGGADGSLRILEITQHRGRTSLEQLAFNRRFARDRKPVSQIQVVPEWNALVTISNGGLAMHSLIPDPKARGAPQPAAPPAIALPAPARGALRFAIAPRAGLVVTSGGREGRELRVFRVVLADVEEQDDGAASDAGRSRAASRASSRSRLASRAASLTSLRTPGGGHACFPTPLADLIQPRRVEAVETVWERKAFGEVKNVTSLAVEEAAVLPPSAAAAATVALSLGAGGGAAVDGLGGGFSGRTSSLGGEVEETSRGHAAARLAATASSSFVVCVLVGMSDGVVAFDVSSDELLDVVKPGECDEAWARHARHREAAGATEGEEAAGVTKAPAEDPAAAAKRVGVDDWLETGVEVAAAGDAAIAAGTAQALSTLASMSVAWVPVPPDAASLTRTRGLPGVDPRAVVRAERKQRSGGGAASAGRSSAQADPSALGQGDVGLDGSAVLLAVSPGSPDTWDVDGMTEEGAARGGGSGAGEEGREGEGAASRGQAEDDGTLDLLPTGDDAGATMGLDLESGRSAVAAAKAAGAGGAAAGRPPDGEWGPGPSDEGAAATLAALASGPVLNRRLLVAWHRFGTVMEVQPGTERGQVGYKLPGRTTRHVHTFRWSAPPRAVMAAAAQPTVLAFLPGGIEAHDAATGRRVASVPINTVVTAVRCEETVSLLRASLSPSRMATAGIVGATGGRSLGPVAAAASRDVLSSATRGEALLDAAARWWVLCSVLRRHHGAFAGELPDATPSDSALLRAEEAIETQAEGCWGSPGAAAAKDAAAWAARCLSEPETFFMVCQRAVVAVTLRPPVVEVASLVTGSSPLFAPALRTSEAAVWRAKRVRAVARQRRRVILDRWLSSPSDDVGVRIRRAASGAPQAAASAASAAPSAGPRSARTDRLRASAAAARSDPPSPSPEAVFEAACRAMVLAGPEERSGFAFGGGVRRSRVREIQAIMGYRRFNAGSFSEGLGHLLLAGERPKRVLALFPQLLPRGVALRRSFPVRVGFVVGHVMDEAVEGVVRYLAIARRWLALRRRRVARLRAADPWRDEDAADFDALVAEAGVPGGSSVLTPRGAGWASASSASSEAGAAPPAPAAAAPPLAAAVSAPRAGRSAAVIDVTRLDPAGWSMSDALLRDEDEGSDGSLLSGAAVGLDGAAAVGGENARRRRFCRVENQGEEVLVDTCLAAACIAWEEHAVREASAGGEAPAAGLIRPPGEQSSWRGGSDGGFSDDEEDEDEEDRADGARAGQAEAEALGLGLSPEAAELDGAATAGRGGGAGAAGPEGGPGVSLPLGPARPRRATVHSASGGRGLGVSERRLEQDEGVKESRRALRLLLTSHNLCDTAETTLRLRRAGKWAEVLLLLTSRGAYGEAVRLLSLSLEARVAEAASLGRRYASALRAARSDDAATQGGQVVGSVAGGGGGIASGAAGAAGAAGRGRGGAGDRPRRSASGRRQIADTADAAGKRRGRARPAPQPRAAGPFADEAMGAGRHWRASLRRVSRRLRLLLAYLSCLGRESQSLVQWSLRPLVLGGLGEKGRAGALAVLRQRRPGEWLETGASLLDRSDVRRERRTAVRKQAIARAEFGGGRRRPSADGEAKREEDSDDGEDGAAVRESDVPSWVPDDEREAWARMQAEAQADAAMSARLPWWSGVGRSLGLGLGVDLPFSRQPPLDPDAALAWLRSLPRGAGDATTALLEFVVHEVGDPTQRFHQQLADRYAATVLRGLPSRPSDPPVRAADEEGPLGSARRRLLRLLEESPAVPAAPLLARLPADDMHDERVVLLRRLGRRDEALRVCLEELGDLPLALECCDRAVAEDLLDAEGAPAALSMSGRAGLQAAASLAARRMGGGERPDDAAVRVPDAPVGAGSLPASISSAWSRLASAQALRASLRESPAGGRCRVGAVSAGPVLSSSSRRHPVYTSLVRAVVAAQRRAVAPLRPAPAADAATADEAADSKPRPHPRRKAAAAAASSATSSLALTQRLVSPPRLSDPRGRTGRPAAATRAPTLAELVEPLRIRAALLRSDEILAALPDATSLATLAPMLAALASSVDRDLRGSAIEEVLTSSGRVFTEASLAQRRTETASLRAQRAEDQERAAKQAAADADRRVRSEERQRADEAAFVAARAAETGGRRVSRLPAVPVKEGSPDGGEDEAGAQGESTWQARLKERRARKSSRRSVLPGKQ